MMFLKDFFEKINSEIKSPDYNKSMKITQHAKSVAYSKTYFMWPLKNRQNKGLIRVVA